MIEHDVWVKWQSVGKVVSCFRVIFWVTWWFCAQSSPFRSVWWGGDFRCISWRFYCGTWPGADTPYTHSQESYKIKLSRELARFPPPSRTQRAWSTTNYTTHSTFCTSRAASSTKINSRKLLATESNDSQYSPNLRYSQLCSWSLSFLRCSTRPVSSALNTSRLCRCKSTRKGLCRPNGMCWSFKTTAPAFLSCDPTLKIDRTSTVSIAAHFLSPSSNPPKCPINTHWNCQGLQRSCLVNFRQ